MSNFEQMELDFGDDFNENEISSSANEQNIFKSGSAKDLQILNRLGFEKTHDKDEIAEVIKCCHLADKNWKEDKTYADMFTDINPDNCEIYKLYPTYPYPYAPEETYPLYAIRYNNSWNLLQNHQERSILEKEPEKEALYLLFHEDNFSSMISACLTIGEREYTSTHEKSDEKYSKFPNTHYIYLTPKQFIEYGILDQNCIDFYSNKQTKFEHSFYNKLRDEVLVSLGKKEPEPLIKDVRDFDFYKDCTKDWLCKIRGCSGNEELVSKIVDKLYEVFPDIPVASEDLPSAHERAKLIPLICGDISYREGVKDGSCCQFPVNENVLENVFGIYDKSLTTATILDRIHAARMGMSPSEIAKLTEYDYSKDISESVQSVSETLTTDNKTPDLKTPAESNEVDYNGHKISKEVADLIHEINPDGGRARKYNFVGGYDLEVLKTLKHNLDNYVKEPPRESDRDTLEKNKNKAQKEVKRFQKIYDETHDEDARKQCFINCDLAAYNGWQLQKLDMIKDIKENLVPAIKAIYDKGERLNGGQTPETFINDFTNSLINLDFHKLNFSYHYNDSLNPIIDKIIENRLGEKFPDSSTLSESELRHIRELWLANRTNVLNGKTQNRYYFFKSEQDAIEHCVSMGSNMSGSIERINNFFAKNSNDKARIVFLKEEYGIGGSYRGVFGYSTGYGKAGSKGLSVEGYYCEDNNKTQFKSFNRIITWKEICDEIKRQRLLQIFGKDREFDKTPLKIEDDIKIIEENTILKKVEKNEPVKETKPFIKEPGIHYNIYPEHTEKKNSIRLNLHFNKDELLSFVKPENKERMKDLSSFISEEPVEVEISYSDGVIQSASIIGKVNLEKSGICGKTVYLQDNELPSVFGENVEKEILSYCEDNLHKKVEDMKEEYEQMPPSVKKTMDRKLSNYTSVWYKGAGYSVKNMLDSIIESNGADFKLEEEPDGIWHLAYYEHKVRGRMTVDGTMVEYLKRHMKGEYWQNKFAEFEQKMYESYIHSFNPDSVTDEGLEDMLRIQKEGWNTGAVKALEVFIEKRSHEKTVETDTEITENKKMAKEFKELTPEIFAKIYNEEIEGTTCVQMDVQAAKTVLDSLKDRWEELGLKTTGGTIHCVNGYFVHDIVDAREVLRISIIGREEKASSNLDRKTEVIFDSLRMTGDKKKQLFDKYINQTKDIIEKENSHYFEKHIVGKDNIAVPVFKYMLNKHGECFDRYDFSEENKLPYFDIGHAEFHVYKDSIIEYLKSSGFDMEPVDEESPNRVVFNIPLDKVDSLVKELKEKGWGDYDFSYRYEGTTIDGIDAAWCENVSDIKVYSKSEFDLINLDKELSFIEKGEPYISVPFTEGSSRDCKHCHIEGGTIYGFKEGIEKIDRYVKLWNTFIKTDITFNMYDPSKKSYVSYCPNFEFIDNKTTDEYGREKERYQESIVEFVRMICSYPEVLDIFEKTWIEQFTPGVTEEQRKFVNELTEDTFSKAK